jgi:hypothetical protein
MARNAFDANTKPVQGTPVATGAVNDPADPGVSLRATS